MNNRFALNKMSNAKILNNIDALTVKIDDLAEQMREFQKIMSKILQFMSSAEYDEPTEDEYTEDEDDDQENKDEDE